MFKDILQGVFDQLKNSSFLDYVAQKNFYLGPANPPNDKYVVFIEPSSERASEDTYTTGIKEITYELKVFCGLVIQSSNQEQLIGKGNDKGILDFVEDIKDTIRNDLTFGLTRTGSSITQANATTNYNLTSSARYISISLDGKTPSGYNSIDCGTSTLSGTQIASNIQTALRSLGNSSYAQDPYNSVTCTYDTTERKFTISSPTSGGRSSVVVSTGASNDASEILRFNRPVEVRGRNIISSFIGDIRYFLELEEYPVRYATVDLSITEETWVG